jgi:glycosyltransferase involved in cell wall biosynthesis
MSSNSTGVLTSTPIVSIVTPSFQQAEYLEHTILSVLGQDYPQIEYILVDGGSNDGSLEIIRKYSGRFAWWVSEPDEGQADAINKGFRHASGEVIVWLNSDDLFLPGAVRQAVQALSENPTAGMVYGDAITIDENGLPLNRLEFSEWGLEQFVSFRIICQPAVFLRRSVFEQAGWLDPRYHFMLDHQLWIRMARLAPVVHVPGLWAAARQHAYAKNVSQPAEFGSEAFKILEWMGTQEDLSRLVRSKKRQVKAGVYRLNARYLLDGKMPSAALRSYAQALVAQPGFALVHWHRIVFALLSLFGGGSLGDRYYRLKRKRRLNLKLENGINSWPGLCLEEGS